MNVLNDMALFVEVARAMSFTKAAETLGIPNSTLSRRVAALEKAVGLRLLHRTTRKVNLTEAGQLYFQQARRIVDEARLAHERLGEMLQHPSGVLRASLPADFASVFLAPVVVEFAELYPNISFEFDLTPRNVDLVTEPYDVAIRMGEPRDSGLVARLLARLPGYLYASPKYLELAGVPATPEDLAQHQCLDFPRGRTWRLQCGDQSREVQVGGRFTLNSVSLVLRLAMLHQGIMFTPKEVVAESIADGSLVRVLPEWHGAPVPVYALTETRLLPAKTQRFLDFLRDRLATSRCEWRAR